MTYDHLNHPNSLPPVQCPLVIEVDGQFLLAERTTHLRQRDGQMTYQLQSGAVLTGRYWWTYP